MDLFHSPGFPSHLEDLMNQHHVPGLAIAIVQNDQIVSAGYGKASVEPPKPCTADTLFDIASSAKSLTAASVGLLVDDNENYPNVQPAARRFRDAGHWIHGRSHCGEYPEPQDWHGCVNMIPIFRRVVITDRRTQS